MKKRLFIGIPLPEDILLEIEKLEKQVDSRLPWIPIENLHLTFVFLGWLEEDYIDKLKQVLNQIKAEKFSLMIEKIDYAPSRKMIWLYLVNTDSNGLSANLNRLEVNLSGIAKLKLLQRKTVTCLKENRIPFEEETREYLPHINLIRLKSPYKKEIAKNLKWELEVKEISLYESTLGKPFSRYKVLETIRL